VVYSDVIHIPSDGLARVSKDGSVEWIG